MPGSTSQSSTASNIAQPSPEPAKQNFFERFLQKFAVLKSAPRELWILFIIKFLSVCAYGLMNKTLVLWLSRDFGFSDQRAGFYVSALWAPLMTGVTLLVGSLTDAIGLRKTFFIGVFICIFARTVMAFSTIEVIALALGLFPLAIGEALGNPVLVAATRKFSSTRQRSIAFSLIYAVMNLGFLVASSLFDSLRHNFGEQAGFNLAGFHFSTYRGLFLLSLGFEVLLLPFILLVREGLEVTDEGVKIERKQSSHADQGILKGFWLTVCDGTRETVKLFSTLLKQSGFYRLLAFLLLIGFLKMIYVQMDYVFPKFGIRELGEGAPVGRLSAINNFLILFLAPLVGAMTQRYLAYPMVIVGGIICAGSVFIMALPPTMFAGLANGLPGQAIGWKYGIQGAINPYYVMIVLQVAIFSVGEAFYSPRVYEYAAAIAPKGQEASYGALSYVPLLLGKLLVGPGGWLLAAFCPEHGPRHADRMWLIFALGATIAPVGLILLRPYISVHEVGRKN